MKYGLFTFLLLLIFSFAKAQTDSCRRKISFGVGVSTGITNINMQKLNAENAKFGIPALSNNFRTYALQLHLASGKLFMLLWREGFTKKVESENSQKVSLKGRTSGLQLGRQFIKGRMAFSPLLGFGGNYSAIEFIRTSTANNVNYNNVFAGGGKNISLINDGTYFFNVSFDLQYLFKSSFLETNRAGIGLNVGYNFGFGKQVWQFKNGTQVNDVPAISNSGPFARVYYRI